MAEVIEGHIRFHVVNLDRGSNAQQAGAVEELIDVIRAYLK
jgi:DNA-binding FrmR family transcriptional regulator